MRVLMVGPGIDVQGGISHVTRLILNNSPHGVEFELVSTLTQKHAISHLSRYSLTYWSRAWLNWRFFTNALRLINLRVQTVDLVHIHLSSGGSTLRKFIVSKQLTRRRKPFILHNHGADYHLFLEKLPSYLKSQIVEMFLSAQGTIVLSEQWRDIHRKFLQCSDYRLWVMLNPIEIPWLNPEDLQNVGSHLVLLYLGRMDELKGSARVLQAIALLPETIRQRVRLRMAGDGEVDATRQLAQDLGLDSICEIRDWIQGAEKLRWIREANAFILPSRAEGLPMSLLEAMAWGKAVITSPVGGIPEIVSDGVEGFLVPPDDIEAISDAIRELVENPERCVQMGLAARSKVEPLDIQHYRVRLGEVYREALDTANTTK